MRRSFFVVLVLALVACDGGNDLPVADSGASAQRDSFVWPDVTISAPPEGTLQGRGLRLLAQVEHPTEGPHLVELAPHGDVFYVANSWDALGAYLLEPDGGLLTTFRRPPPLDEGVFVRCTTISVHASSNTLYCSSDESNTIVTYDLTDPERPTLRDLEALFFPTLYVRDIAVIDDVLYLSRFDRGLWVSEIAADGTLGPAMATGVEEDVRFVDGADPLVAVGASGLHVLEGAGSGASVRATLELGAPPQDVRVVGDRAVVALGSRGAVVVDIGADPPRVILEVEPPGVATSADLWGDALVVATLTGAYLYDLGRTPPRLAGFAPAGRQRNRNGGVMLQARFVEGELVVSDWSWVERYAIDLDGAVLDLDHPRGFYLAPGQGLSIPFRNAGDRDMAVRLAVAGTVVEAPVPPGETATLEVSPEEVSALFERVPEEVTELWPETVVGGATTGSVIVLVRRPETTSPPSDRPAPGDSFPSVAIADGDSNVLHLPMTDRRQRIVFYTTDCAAMWPVLEDAAYLWRRGELDGGAELHLVGRADIGFDGWNARWGLADVPYGHHDIAAPPEVMEENGPGDLYDRFWIDGLQGAAAYPTDYVVSTGGQVERVERYFRGRHGLH